MIENVLEHLIDRFEQGGAHFRVIEHEACGHSSQSVADIRGTALGQGAKALVCQLKGNGHKQFVLAVLPADQQADLSKLATALGARRASLATPEQVLELTGCILGAVPPVSFHPGLRLIVDPMLFTRFTEIAFNAGHRDRSILIEASDFERIIAPEKLAFIKE